MPSLKSKRKDFQRWNVKALAQVEFGEAGVPCLGFRRRVGAQSLRFTMRNHCGGCSGTLSGSFSHSQISMGKTTRRSQSSFFALLQNCSD